MIKLLAFDIDDTLTLDATTVPEKNLEAIKRAKDAGVFVTVATGRGFFGSSEIWKAMHVEGPVINYGGSVINDTRTGKPIYTTSMEPHQVRELFALAHELGVHVHLYQGNSIIYEKDSEYARRYTGFLNLPFEVDPDMMEKEWHDVPKVLYITEPERAEELIPLLRRRFEGKLKVSGSKAGFIEFNEPYAHKGAALAWLADYMGIEREEVAAVGDNLLDLEMIEWAGIGAAVANAHSEVLAAANIVVPSCSEMGAQWFIDNVVLKGR